MRINVEENGDNLKLSYIVYGAIRCCSQVLPGGGREIGTSGKKEVAGEGVGG
jgi:hypothetical protein